MENGEGEGCQRLRHKYMSCAFSQQREVKTQARRSFHGVHTNRRPLIDCNNSEIVTAVGSATIKARLNTLIRPSTRSRPAAAAAAAVPV